MKDNFSSIQRGNEFVCLQEFKPTRHRLCFATPPSHLCRCSRPLSTKGKVAELCEDALPRDLVPLCAGNAIVRMLMCLYVSVGKMHDANRLTTRHVFDMRMKKFVWNESEVAGNSPFRRSLKIAFE